MAGATLQFRFASPAREEAFLETYLADAFDRFETSDHWDHGWYWAYGQFAAYDAGPDGGLVKLVFDGDPGGVIAAERDRWAAFDGLTDWDCRRYEAYGSLREQQRDAKGATGGDREYRGKAHTARFALALRRAFDDLPVDPSRDDDDPVGIGVWTLLHDVLVQAGYDWYDETDAAVRMIENRLRSVAAYRGADAAREEYDRITERLDRAGDDLEEWLAENPTGDASVE
ncbi:MAG: hypothetical protein ABEI75_01815 [Halobaculum sp.]